MAAKRKIQKGLATKIMCVLKFVGRADDKYIAKRFGYSRDAVDRTMASLERQGVVSMSTVMSAGTYGLTQKGYIAVGPRSRASLAKHCEQIVAEGAKRDADYKRWAGR
jgi:predicted ArsR family transcriptional regulator